MANNIIPLDPNNFSSDVYTNTDESLITSNIEQNQFNVNTDYVEYFVFDLNNNRIHPQGEDATFSNYSLLDNEVYVDPVADLENIGIDTGIVNSLYTFYRKWLNSSSQSTYYIKEISSDRTEIRLDSNIIDRADIIKSVTEFVAYREVDETFPDFYINLGSNLLFIANNIKLDTDNTVLIKLYEPLPSNIEVKTSLWIVEKVSEGVAYRVEFEDTQEFRPQFQFILGPNLNLPVKDQLNNSSEAISLSDLSSPNSQSEYQINSYFEDPSISINVDYSDFSNFVNFSSAQNRLENFWYKLGVIQSASSELNTLDSLITNPWVSESRATLNTIIDDTITTFDSYEYYLYFESSSTTYPKSNSTPPYENELTSSLVAQTWITSSLESAEDYDRENQNWLKYGAPEFIRDDSSNDQYMTFLNMIGHFVDNNIWVYIKDTTNKWDADNRIDAGVSKDLVGQVLRDLGVKLYQNNYSTGDLYSSFLGFTNEGILFPYPNMTGSLPAPSGYEYVSNFISSSDDAIALDDINKRIYKRIYHNLPYLLKSKGTVEGLRTLVNVYGIPDTILQISEFGGKDRINTNDWDLWKHQYNFKSNVGTGGSITTDWELNSDWGSTNNRPDSLQFRFNAGLAVSASTTQTLWNLDSGTNVSAVLEYDTSLLNSGSYSGSIKDEEYQYATLKFTLDNFSTSASVRLPFYNNDWWSVQINREGNDFELLAGNKIYSGSDGSQIGFIASSSITTAASSNWGSATTSKFDFEGSYQEIRYFNQAISQSVFKDYVMNPQSIEGNGINGSPSQLAFRASLGGELYTGSISIHPKVDITSSFTGGNNFTPSSVTFIENKEWVFLDSPAVGIKNRNTDKIKQQDLILPTGSTLSNLESIQQTSYTTQDYTNNLNLLEVAFSPQNQINDDIISQIGHFNIGDYIGDPRLISSSVNTYPSLVDLSQQYFDKYSSNYDVYDYIRLIKFFDNSLFKMVKDFVPARTGVATGIVVKQHILERQKYPTPQAEWIRPEYTGSIGSTPALLDGQRIYTPSGKYESNPIETVSGSDGGSIPLNVTQSWTGTHITPSGSVSFTQDDEREFINGEFSGSAIIVTTQSLNPGCDVYKNVDTNVLEYDSTIRILTYNTDTSTQGTNLSDFVNEIFSPNFNFEFWFRAERAYRPDPFGPGGPANPTAIIDTYCIERININKITDNGVDLSDYIPQAKKIDIILPSAPTYPTPTYAGPVTVTDNLGTKFEVEVVNIKEFSNYYSLEIKRNTSLNFTVNYTYTGGLFPPSTGILDFNFFTGPQIVLEPYVKAEFQNSNCNAIFNNATEITPSTVFYDLDYSQGTITPVNFATVIEGTATKAPIQDYNFNLRRSIIPRYSGSKNTSFDYNEQDGSVEKTQAYFAYFNWVGGTSPEWGNGLEDRSGVNLRYIIDELGDVIKPINDSEGINLGILRQNFTEDQISTLAFNDSTGASAAFSNLLGNHEVFKSGKSITPILYSQTESIDVGVNGGFSTTLDFIQGDLNQSAAINDYRIQAYNTGDTIVTTGKVNYQNLVIDGSEADWTGDDTYSPNTADPTTQNVTLYFTGTLKRSGNPVNKIVTAQFFKDGVAVGTPKQFDFSNSYYNSLDISFVDSTATTSNVYDLRITSLSGMGILKLSTDSYINVTQQPLPNIGTCSSPYWTQSGVNDNQIKAHANLKPFYRQKQEDIANSGFFPIVNDFIIQEGDEIRFDGTETQSYRVMLVETTSGNVILTLDRDVTAANLQWFLIRRYIDDASNIILKVDKPSGGTSPGILKPQYLSKEVEDNINDIIEKLKIDNLI
jgi:hypothetical protein